MQKILRGNARCIGGAVLQMNYLHALKHYFETQTPAAIDAGSRERFSAFNSPTSLGIWLTAVSCQ